MLILVIFLVYDRIQMLIENIKRFERNKELLESIIVVWNHPDFKPESYVWPTTPYPVHVSSPLCLFSFAFTTHTHTQTRRYTKINLQNCVWLIHTLFCIICQLLMTTGLLEVWVMHEANYGSRKLIITAKADSTE